MADGPGGDLMARFADDRWTAGVVGLGYVGLPLAVTAVRAGLRCIGFDVSSTVVERLTRGSVPTSATSATSHCATPSARGSRSPTRRSGWPIPTR